MGFKRSGNQKRKTKKSHSKIPGFHTTSQWKDLKKAYGGCCAYCGEPNKTLTKDHIIPASRPDLGATNYIWNIIPACAKCNITKADHIYRFRNGEFYVQKEKSQSTSI